jgi:hypothetical protein
LNLFVNPTLRKFNLTMHVAVSVGWLGAVLAYLPFAIRSVTGVDPEAAPTTYGAMNTIGWGVIVPCAFGALVTGLIQSLGTSWGLFRHYWILAKFVLTVGGITILLMHMPLVSRLAQSLEGGMTMAGLAGSGKPLLVHATGGIVVLGLALILSVFKPWGLTPYGRHQLQSVNFAGAAEVGGQSSVKRGLTSKIWVTIAILGIGAIVAFAILHHLRGGVPSH